jgi:hypothetical protein
MERVKDVASLVTRLGPVIYARDRRAALKRRGIVVEHTLPAKVRAGLSVDPLGLSGRRAAATVAGPTVPISIELAGAGAAGQREPRSLSGFDVIGTVFLSSFEEILAKLWDALVYPQDVDTGDAAKLVDVPLLRSCFTGVPAGAELGPLLLPAPPQLRVAAGDLIELIQSFRIQLVALGGGILAELVAVARVTFPLALVVNDGRLGADLFRIVAETRVAVTVEAGSGLQPVDAAGLQAFADHLSGKVGSVLALAAKKLERSAVFDVPGGSGESKLRIVAAAVWLSTTSDDQGQIIVGIQLEPEPDDRPPRDDPSADTLAAYATRALFPPNTIAILASESLVERALRSIVASGELSERFSDKLHWLSLFSLPTHIKVRNATTRFDDGKIKLGLDCTYLDVCAFRTDLDFRVTVDLRPSIVDGDLRLDSDSIDIDLDNVDAAVCVLSSPLTGLFGFLLLTVGTVLAEIWPLSFNKKHPSFWQGQRLPDSDVSPRVDLTAVPGRPSTGSMQLTGSFWLAPDELSTFVATQVLAVSERTGEVNVVDGATVELSELGLPAPVGDDYVPPKDRTGEYVEADGTLVRISTQYAGTLADQVLATATSERHGLARFAVALDDIGGLVNTTITRTSPAGPAFTIHRVDPATGDAPDLAVTVTLKDGYQPLVRQPIVTNLPGRRLGTVHEPVRLVYPDICITERQAVVAATKKVDDVQNDLRELREEYDHAPPSEQDAIGRTIRRIERDFLKPAIAAVKNARAARDACAAADH